MRIRLTQLYFFFISCPIGLNSYAQDFSFTEFENERDSTKRIEMAIESWNYYLRNCIDSIRIVGHELIHIDSVSFYPIGIRNLGSYHVRTNDINRGIELLKEARNIFSSHHSTVLLSETENELGNAYYLQGNYNQASTYYFASIFHGSGTADLTARYNGMIGFGKTVCAVGDTARGLLFIQKYLERCLRDNKYESASDACGYLGMIAGMNGRIELMSAYYNRGIRYASKSNSKTHRANAYTNKAIDYFYHDKVDSSIYYFNEALLVRQEVGATRPIVESYYNLALLNIETNNLDQAREFAEKGEFLSGQGGIRSWQLDCLILLLEIAEKRKDAKEIGQLKVDIERIKGELMKTGTLDDQIIDTAVEFTALVSSPIRPSYFWELLAGLSLILSCGIMLYTERSSST